MFSDLFSRYPTFAVFLAVFVAIILTVAFMPAWIRFLKKEHLGQQVRDDGPKTHLVKQGTPTMGGVVMLIAVVLTIFLVGCFTSETFCLLAAIFITGADANAWC